MAQRNFRPVLRSTYPQPPDIDPVKFPVEKYMQKLTFGELFHEMYRRAVNLYDVSRTGPGHEGPAMELMTNLVISFLIETASWVEGQVPAMPDVRLLYAKFMDLRRQAFRYEYEHQDQQTPAVSTLVAAAGIWFIPRVVVLAEKAKQLKSEIRAGQTRVRVTATFDMLVDVKAENAGSYVKETACKELFAADSCQFIGIKAIHINTDEDEDS